MANKDPNPYEPGMAIPETPSAPRGPVRPAVFLWAAFATALGSPQVLWNPFVRELLGDDRAQVGSFFMTAWIPMILSPLWACLTDRVPVMVTRREGYLVIAGTLAIAGWAATPFLPQAYGPYLAVSLVLGLAVQVASMAVNGGLVELGHRFDNTSLLAAAMYGISSAAVLIAGAVSEPLNVRPLWSTAIVGAALGLSVVLVATMSSDDFEPRAVDQLAVTRTSPRLRDHLLSVKFWSALAIATLAHLGTSNAQVTRERKMLNFHDDVWWTSQRPSQLAILISAAAYGVLSRHVQARRLVIASLLGGSLASVFGSVLDRSVSPMMLGLLLGVNALGHGFVAVAVIDIALRVAPPRWEALGYLLLTGTSAIVSIPLVALSFTISLTTLSGLNAALVALAALVTIGAAKRIFPPLPPRPTSP